MAKKGEKTDQQRTSSGGSIFKTAVIGAPIAIGGGIGISRLSKRSSHFGQVTESLPHNPAADSIRQFSNRYVSPQHSAIFKDWQIDKLAGFSKNVALSKEQIHSTFMRAAHTVDPTGNIANTMDARLAAASSPQDALKAISISARNSSSVYMSRTVNQFMDVFSVMNTRAHKGLPTVPSSLGIRVQRQMSSPRLSQLDPVVSKYLTSAQEQLGGASVFLKRYAREELAGSELSVKFSGGMLEKPIYLRIPETLSNNRNLITRGYSQQSRYIAGMYGVVENNRIISTLDHSQWTARRFAEDIIPQITSGKLSDQRAIRNAVSTFERSMMEAPEWIPTIPEGLNPGVDEYTRLRSNIMRLRDTAGNTLDEFAYARIIEQGGLQGPSGFQVMYPGASPGQIAKGVVSTADTRNILSVVPEAVPYGRRPLQMIRKDFAPTAEALSKMSSNPHNWRMSWAAAKAGVSSPMVRAAYVSSSHDVALTGTGMTSEGQLLVSKDLAAQRAVKRWRHFDVAADRLLDLNPMLTKGTGSGASWKLNKRIIHDDIVLGFSPEGKPVHVPAGTKLLGAVSFENDKAKQSFIRVLAEEEITNMPYSKVFGGAKGMAAQVETNYIGKVLAKIGIDGEHADALITMDELKKNRGLHYNQMFTALWDYTEQNMQNGLAMSEMSDKFRRNPHSVIADLRKSAIRNGKFDHQFMLDQIKSIARGSKLDPNQFGSVFGAVPDVFGDIGVLGKMSVSEASAVSRGMATGYTQLFFEGLGGPGAGNMATIEPRMFELLSSPHFKGLGPELQKEIAGRMLAAYPEKVSEQRLFTRALESLHSSKTIPGAIGADELLGELGSMKSPVSTTAMKTPMGDILIPGSGEVAGLTAYKTASGTIVQSELADRYRDVIESVSKYERGDIAKEALQKEIDTLQGEISKARALTVTGPSGMLRNRVPGSRSLTAVLPIGTDVPDLHTVGITQSYADQMFQDMERIHGKQEIASMRRRFGRGEAVTGLLARHPFIGPYSTQAAKFKMIPGEQAIAAIPEQFKDVTALAGKHGAETMLNAGENLTVRLSPLVGLAGDVDGDIVSAFMVSPKMETKLAEHLTDQSVLEAYENYSIRSQLLKAKAQGDEVTLRKIMAGDALKLSVTEGGRLGRLSTHLQEYRAAVLSGSGGLSSQASMDALGLLEWMEQTPISGKHIAPGREVEMLHLLDDMQEAFARQNASGIAETARTVMAKAKPEGRAALNEGLTIMKELAGQPAVRHIPGIDISRTAENIVNAHRAYEAAVIGGASAAEGRKLIMGRITPSAAQSQASMVREFMDMSPFGGFFEASEGGRMTRLAGRFQTMTNRLGQAGKSMLAHAKPLAIGTGIALGLAAVLSNPPESMSAARVAPTANMTSGTGGANVAANIHPAPHPVSRPTVSNHTRTPNTARISSGNRVSVHGISGPGIDYGQLSDQIRQAAGSNNITTNVRDNRSSMTPQKVSRIIKEG